MKEQIKKPKIEQTGDIITDEQIIKAFKEKGVDDQESGELLLKYIDECHAQADAEAKRNPDQSNIINIKTEVKVAELYSYIPDKDYQESALESLELIYQNAGNDELPNELVERISNLIKILKSELR